MSANGTPQTASGSITNLAGQGALRYRVDTRSGFATGMREALGTWPALAGLVTREPDDPLIALTDAWAGVLDVLTFYQERIANEGFLGTATERRSVLELGRSLGYELSPGVAATTWLNIEVVPAPGGIDSFSIAAGTSAQSIPGPGEQPQVFETVEEIVARPEWNSIPVVCALPLLPTPPDATLRLDGTDLVLQPGDPILVLCGGSSPWSDVRRVAATEVVQAVLASPTDPVPLVPAHTVVTLDAPLVANSQSPNPAAGVSGVAVYVLRQRAALFGYNAPSWDALPVSLRVGEFNPEYEIASTALRVGDIDLIAERSLLPISIAKATEQVPRLLEGAYSNRQSSWADAPFAAGTSTADLDQVYPRIIKDSYVVFEKAGSVAVRRLKEVSETPRSDFGLAARVSHLTFVAGDLAGYSPRTTSVLGQSEPLRLAEVALAEVVGGVDSLDLARVVPEIAPGRTVAITGQDEGGSDISEIAVVKLVEVGAGVGPRLRFTRTLTHSYLRTSVRVLANVAKATHGESRAEIVGSGDQRLAFQTFTLRQKPVTHVSSSTGSGSQTTLAIWVAGVRWKEVPSFYGQGPDDRVYTTRRADDGAVTVTFGDGRTGARLPSGSDNVVATYRIGIGLAAVLAPGRISIPLARPLGLQNVVNPVAASGADDPESLAAARSNAPMAVRTLGRIVSVVDYEDLAKAFAGIGKARADVLWDGERPVLHLTVTGPGGSPIEPTSATAADLRSAIDIVRHPTVPVVVTSYRPRRFAIDARIVVAPDRRPADVIADVTAALVARYSFEPATLARSLPVAEVVATMHTVPGVVAVVVQAFHDSALTATKEDVIIGLPASRTLAGIEPADLVTIDPLAIHLVEAVSTPTAGAL